MPSQTVGLSPFKRSERPVLIETLLTDPEVLAAVADRAAETGATRDEITSLVRRYVREIVPHFNATLYYRLAYGVARAVATALYRVRVGYLDEPNLERIPRDSTVVFVMNHRSNMDYVLVAFLVSGHVAISYAVGEWARVWPLDTLIRALGGYFVRRQSGDRLYRKVLERYVQLATTHGVPQGIFPEGGLSRDGLIRLPKAGLFYYATKRFDPAADRDLIFVPVALNYDRVLEDRSLLLDLDPEAPRPSTWRKLRTLSGFVGKNAALYVRGRFYRFGYACVNFGTPLSMKGYTAERKIDWQSLTDPQRFDEAETLVRTVMDEVARIIPVTPVSLVAAALLQFQEWKALQSALAARTAELLETLRAAGAHPYVPRNDPAYFFQVGLRMLTIRRLVRLEEGWCVGAREQERVLRYYANSVSHLILPLQR